MLFLRRSLMGIFLLALTLALLGYAANMIRTEFEARMNAEPRSFPQRERVISVNVVPYEAQTIAPEMTVFGEVQSALTLDIRAAVGGTVTEVSPSFVEGGRVQAGDVLLRIDPAEAEDAVARIRADLRDAEAAGRDAERNLALARDELAAAEVQSQLRQTALQRQRDLQQRGIGTAPELEAAELAASSAAQAVLSRRQAVASAEAQIDTVATTLARVQINLAEAERRLEDTTIRAAFDGVLSGVSTSVGGRVTANEHIAQLIDPTRLELAFRVSTAQYATLLTGGPLEGTPVRASLDAGGTDITVEGVITREGATVGEGQVGRLIFARLDPAPGFRPGDFVTVTIMESPLEAVALLPAAAVAADGQVLVVGEEDRLRTAPVEVLRRQGDDVIVRANALRGQMIVAERTPLLGSGIAVRPIGPGGPEAVPETIVLDPERRARLIAFIEGNAYIPADAKARTIAQLEQDEVPTSVVERIESSMGG